MPSQNTQGLLQKLSIEDAFHKMLLVRYGWYGLDNLYLIKDWECEGECEGQKGCYDGHKETRIITHNKILVARDIKGKTLGTIPLLSNFCLQKNVFLNIKSKNNF